MIELVLYLIAALLYGRAAKINHDGPPASLWVYVLVGIGWLPYLVLVNVQGKVNNGDDQ